MQTNTDLERTKGAALAWSDELGDDEEPCCLICGGEGTVDGSDNPDWDEDEYGELVDCPSCGGSGKAADMSYC